MIASLAAFLQSLKPNQQRLTTNSHLNPSDPFGYTGADDSPIGDGFGLYHSDKSTSDYFNELAKDRQIRSYLFLQNSYSGELAKLFDHYGSDKGSRDFENILPKPYQWQSHTYAHFYDLMFSPIRLTTRSVFECGLGTTSADFGANMGVTGKPGASLRAWRDFFPNAHIYGADIDPTCLFNEDRISTTQVDQTSEESVKKMWDSFGNKEKFDIMIDDGLHNYQAGSNLFTFSIEHLRTGGFYIIEDINPNFLASYDKFFSNRKISYQINATPRLITTKTPGKPEAVAMENNIFIAIIK